MKINEAHKLAIELMKIHNLIGWNFKFTSARNRFGFCSYQTKTIGLSEPLTLLNSITHVKNTILHEIAHALVDPKEWHNKVWKDKAISIGCTGDRFYSQEVIRPMARYTVICPNGHSSQKNRKRLASCGRCSSKFNKEYLLRFTKN